MTNLSLKVLAWLSRYVLWVLSLWLLISQSNAVAGRPDLPIGHFKITDGTDGTINVAAPCVALKDAVEAIAKHAGKAVEFEKPCNVFITVSPSQRQAPAEDWARRLVILGGNGSLGLRIENGAWQIRTHPEGNYDTALTEEQVLDAFAKTTITMTPVSEGINTGIYVYAGHCIPPPYKVDVKEDGAGGFDVLVNGVIISRYAPPLAKAISQAKPDLPPSGQFDDLDTLSNYVIQTLYPQLLKQGLRKEDAIARVAEFLSKQQRVVEVHSNGTPEGLTMTVMVQEKQYLVGVFPANWDMDTGKQRPPSGPVVPLETQAERLKASTEEGLRNGGLIIQTRLGMTTSYPSSGELHSVLLFAKSLPLFQAECVVNEYVNDRLVARDIVSGLRSSGGLLLNVIERSLSERK